MNLRLDLAYKNLKYPLTFVSYLALEHHFIVFLNRVIHIDILVGNVVD